MVNRAVFAFGLSFDRFSGLLSGLFVFFKVKIFDEGFLLFGLFLGKLKWNKMAYIGVVQNVLHHFVLRLAAVFKVLLALLVLARLFVLLFLCLDCPAALSERLSDGLVGGQDVGRNERVFVGHVMIFFISRVERGVLNKLL